MDTTKKALSCIYCDKTFSSKSNVTKHQRLIHGHIYCTVKNVACSFGNCMSSFVSLFDLRQHCVSEHDFVEEKEVLTFTALTDFKAWKEQEEKNSRCQFVKTTGAKNLKGGGVKSYYTCKRSGEHRSKSKDVRQMKSQGSCKTGKCCLAAIEMLLNPDMTVSVTYYSGHFGHQHDIGHLTLSDSDKASIAGKLASGVSMQRILDDIRDSVTGDLSRIHLTTRQDLRNIKCEYDINNVREKCHSNDKLSIGIWVEKMKNVTDNPVIFFKQQGEVDKTKLLDDNDFMIVIMIPAQRTLLSKLGSQKICIDSTHGTNGYDFQLTTILTIDEFGSGFPCAFCLSNRIDKVAYSKFFSAIKENMGLLSCKVFMSDDAPAIYNAWKQVMGEAEKQLLCSWHVDRNWRLKLRELFTDKLLQGLIYKTLRVLLEEHDVTKFHATMNDFLYSLNQEKTVQFRKYFVSKYAARPTLWAYCYRVHVGLNTNMHLESMHRVLKYCYLDAKKNKRVDTCIAALLKMTRDKLFDRLIKICKGDVTYRLSLIHKRHTSSKAISSENVSLDYNDPTSSSNCKWTVQSQSVKGIIYTVQQETYNPSECSTLHGRCQLYCSKCKVCVHAFSCTCTDYLIHFNMCKHIHAVVQHIQPKDFGNNAEMCDSEIDNPNALLRSIQTSFPNTHGDSLKENTISKLNVAIGNVEGNKVEPRMIAKLDDMLDRWLKECEDESYSMAQKTKLEPSNKNIEQQRCSYKSTKRRKTDNHSNISLSRPTAAQKENILTMLSNPASEVLEIHTGNDHDSY